MDVPDPVSTFEYDDTADQLIVKTSYDPGPVLESNKRIKNAVSSKAIQRYKGNMVHAARFHKGDIERLIKLGYNILSPDPDEVRRALVYVQDHESHLLLVHGKPFAKQRITW